MRLRPPPAAFAAFIVALLGGPARAQQTQASDVDCAAAFNDGWKLRDAGRQREARDRFLLCSQPVLCPSFVSHCTEAAQELSAAIPSVVFAIRDSKGAAIGDVTVTLDGVTLGKNVSGAPIEVDPGRHAFTFASPGYEPAAVELDFAAGRKAQAETITMSLLPTAPQGSPSTPVPSSAAPAPFVDGGPKPSAGLGKPIALVLGGMGLVAVGVGSWLALRASSTYGTAKSECQPLACGAGSPAQNDYGTAATSADAATVLFAAGGVALAGAGVMWILSSKAGPGAKAAVQIAPVARFDGAALMLDGTF
jgi:hypothetical protein